MKPFIRNAAQEIYNIYHTYFFTGEKNRKKLLKYTLTLVCFFFCWLVGYKWRDTKLILQQIKIEQLTIKKEKLISDIDTLNEQLEEYNFMLNDGDWYRYLAHKHADVMVPKIPVEDLKLMTDMAKRYKIPFKYFYRLINKESRYNPDATSPVGARGYMQIMPETFVAMKSRCDIDVSDMSKKHQNIIVGSFMLSYLYKKYKDWPLVFAAYNAGSLKVDECKCVPQIPETQAYVRYITNN